MLLAIVRGEVVATQKDPNLAGYRIALVEPVDESLRPIGAPFAAIDIVSSRNGDLVMWIDSGEAPKALPGKFAPVDATIVGIIDAL